MASSSSSLSSSLFAPHAADFSSSFISPSPSSSSSSSAAAAVANRAAALSRLVSFICEQLYKCYEQEKERQLIRNRRRSDRKRQSGTGVLDCTNIDGNGDGDDGEEEEDGPVETIRESHRDGNQSVGGISAISRWLSVVHSMLVGTGVGDGGYSMLMMVDPSDQAGDSDILQNGNELKEFSAKDRRISSMLLSRCLESYDGSHEAMISDFYNSHHLGSFASILLQIIMLNEYGGGKGATSVLLVEALAPIAARMPNMIHCSNDRLSLAKHEEEQHREICRRAMEMIISRVLRGIDRRKKDSGNYEDIRNLFTNPAQGTKAREWLSALPDYHAAIERKSDSGQSLCVKICLTVLDVTKDLHLSDSSGISCIGNIFTKMITRGYADSVAHSVIAFSVHTIQDSLPPRTKETRDSLPHIALTLSSIEQPRAQTQIATAVIKSLIQKKVEVHRAVQILNDCFPPSQLCLNDNNQYYKNMFGTIVEEIPTQKCAKWPKRALKLILSFCAQDRKLMRGMCDAAIKAFASNIVLNGATPAEQSVLAATILHFLKLELDENKGLHFFIAETQGDDDDEVHERVRRIFRGIESRLQSEKEWLRNHASCIGNSLSHVMTPGKELFPEAKLCSDIEITYDGFWDHDKKCSPDECPGECLHDNAEKLKELYGGVENSIGIEQNEMIVTDKWFKEPTSSGDKIPKYEDYVLNVHTDHREKDCVAQKKQMTFDEDRESDSDDSLEAYEMNESDQSDDEIPTSKSKKKPQHALSDIIGALREKPENEKYNRRACELALQGSEEAIRMKAPELREYASALLRALLFASLPTMCDKEIESIEKTRLNSLVALLVTAPKPSMKELIKILYSGGLDVYRRLLLLNAVSGAAKELYSFGRNRRQTLHVNPKADNQNKDGKTRIWGKKSKMLREQESLKSSPIANQFGPVAATFMLPLMLQFDERKQGVQMLENCDSPVLAQLLETLGDCILCCHGLPHARSLSAKLLDLLKVREIVFHDNAAVRSNAFKTGARALKAISAASLSSAMCSSNSDDLLLVSSLEKLREIAVDAARHDSDEHCRVSAGLFLHIQAETATEALQEMGITGDELEKLTIISNEMLRLAV